MHLAVPVALALLAFLAFAARRTLTYEWVRIYMFSGLKGVGLNPRYQALLRKRVFTPVVTMTSRS